MMIISIVCFFKMLNFPIIYFIEKLEFIFPAKNSTRGPGSKKIYTIVKNANNIYL